MPIQSHDFKGRPALALSLATGERTVVALHGAHVLSWTTADGVERLYLSPDAVFDGHAAIRGGVPVCWPQFNTRGPLAKHGFARTLPWTAANDAKDDSLALVLEDNAETRAVWRHAFSLRLTVTLAPQQLRVTLDVANRGETAVTFTTALHSYLRVDEIADARLHGLKGAARWDAVRDVRQTEAAEALQFDAEFDSVYASPPAPLRLVQPAGTLQIEPGPNCTETVVWNPGAALAAKLADLPDDGYRHMLCVEAACIDAPVVLAPGARWQAWQQLNVI